MIAASHIYQMMLDADVSNVKCLTFANADVAEFTVKAGSKITQRKSKRIAKRRATEVSPSVCLTEPPWAPESFFWGSRYGCD